MHPRRQVVYKGSPIWVRENHDKLSHEILDRQSKGGEYFIHQKNKKRRRVLKSKVLCSFSVVHGPQNSYCYSPFKYIILGE